MKNQTMAAAMKQTAVRYECVHCRTLGGTCIVLARDALLTSDDEGHVIAKEWNQPKSSTERT